MLAMSSIKTKCSHVLIKAVLYRNFNLYSELQSRKKFEHASPIECEGFIYYPRYPGQKDPPYQPSKLFMVQRIKPLKGAPYWEKSIMHQLKLDGQQKDIVIVKNIPENNARLWNVKHLIKITPITFPNGPPKECDIGATFLKENGQLMVSKNLEINPTRLEINSEKEKSKMDPETIRKLCRLKWINPWKT